MLGWGKASKCKKLVKQVRSRLECLIEERSAFSTILRNDVEKLDYEALNLRIQHEERISDETWVYNFLLHFCDYILMHFFYIRTHKQCRRRRNLAEAISSLVFASSRLRCGVVSKLEEIRDLFGERYGESFVETAVKLLPGNLVDPTFQKNVLSLFPDLLVANDTVKHELVRPSFTSSSPDEVPERSASTEKEENENRKNQLQLISLQSPFHVHPKLPDEVPKRSSAEKEEDENRNNQLQLISLQPLFHVHPKFPDWDDISTRFSAIKRPKYVHPKLPDYDDITAQFDALKSLNNVNTTRETLRLESIEYYHHDQHDITDIDDRELFNYSWLPLEPAPLLLLA